MHQKYDHLSITNFPAAYLHNVIILMIVFGRGGPVAEEDEGSMPSVSDVVSDRDELECNRKQSKRKNEDRSEGDQQLHSNDSQSSQTLAPGSSETPGEEEEEEEGVGKDSVEERGPDSRDDFEVCELYEIRSARIHRIEAELADSHFVCRCFRADVRQKC